jgi:hypothetical protein
MMITAYFLPTGKGKHALWSPHDAKMGEIPNCELVVLSPVPLEDELEEIKALVHDNLFRFQAQRGLPKRYAATFWFRMIWGLLSFFAFADPLEDTMWGLYLLFGVPVFANIVEGIWKARAHKVMTQFDSTTYWPEGVRVQISGALQKLADIVEKEGNVVALRSLYDLGLPELIGFYRRAAWSGRWEVGPPSGMGVFENLSGQKGGEGK